MRTRLSIHLARLLALACLALVAYPVLSPASAQALPPQPSNIEQIVEAASMASYPIYYDVVKHYFGYDPKGPTFQKATPNLGGGSPGILSPLYWVQVTDDSALDCETTMTNVKINISGVDTDHTVLGYMKHIAGTSNNWRTHVAATKTGQVGWTHTQILMPLGEYTRAVDPVLHVNPFTDGSYPKRVYLVELVDNYLHDPFIPLRIPQSIALTYSDNGGMNWTTPTPVDTNQTTGRYLDKPDMEVSWNLVSRGNVFVAYMDLNVNSVNPNADDQRLYVRRSTTGGASWDPKRSVAIGRIHAPQIVVNPGTGRVYCLWTDYVADQIKMSYSDDQGVSWSLPETAASGPLKTDENSKLTGRINESGVNIGVNARTVPQARFDTVNNRLIVTWHESEYAYNGTHTGGVDSSIRLVDSTKNFVALGVKVGDYIRNVTDDSYCFVKQIESTTSLLVEKWASWKPSGQADKNFDTNDLYILKALNTDIYYTAKYTSTAWLPKVKLAIPLSNDQFQPAVDFSSTGELMVGYYDRSADAANILYEVRWVKFNADGNVIASGQLPDPFYSDPTDNTPLPGFIGDYMDHWFWPYTDSYGPRFHSVYCAGPRPGGNPYLNGDIYLAGLQ